MELMVLEVATLMEETLATELMVLLLLSEELVLVLTTRY
jgi:hypothetical protein